MIAVSISTERVSGFFTDSVSVFWWYANTGAWKTQIEGVCEVTFYVSLFIPRWVTLTGAFIQRYFVWLWHSWQLSPFSSYACIHTHTDTLTHEHTHTHHCQHMHIKTVQSFIKTSVFSSFAFIPRCGLSAKTPDEGERKKERKKGKKKSAGEKPDLYTLHANPPPQHVFILRLLCAFHLGGVVCRHWQSTFT